MTYLPPTSSILFPSGLSAAGITGYLQLVKPPLTAASEVDLTQAVIVGDGEVMMQAFVSPALGLTEIAAGDWTLLIGGSVDTVSGVSEIIARVYKRNAAGSETLLFNITTGDLTTSAALYTVVSAQALFSLTAVTDRLVVKFFAKTASATTRTIHLFYLGEAHQTRVLLPVYLVITPGGDMAASLYDEDLDGKVAATGGHTIDDEGTPLPTRTHLNFTGAGVLATDNAGTDSTDVTITGDGGGSMPAAFNVLYKRTFR